MGEDVDLVAMQAAVDRAWRAWMEADIPGECWADEGGSAAKYLAAEGFRLVAPAPEPRKFQVRDEVRLGEETGFVFSDSAGQDSLRVAFFYGGAIVVDASELTLITPAPGATP